MHLQLGHDGSSGKVLQPPEGLGATRRKFTEAEGGFALWR